jgi:pimeloyl-ACP methyl ester carboxylesterase
MRKDVSFICDGFQLQGTLHLPAADRPPIVIGCHGLMADRHSPKQLALAEECNRLGIAYLRIDHRGCGDSQGRFEEVTTLAARCRDLEAALAWTRGKGYFSDRVGLFGSSLGGAVCLASAGRLNTTALVTVAAPVRSQALAEKAALRSNHLPATGFFTTPERQFDILPQLENLSRILMFHGQKDEIVPLSHAEEILACLHPPKRLVVLKDGDHRMSNPADQETFISLASNWYRRFLL